MSIRLSNSPSLSFSSVVGNEELKIALILNAVDPKIGGVLVQGHKGTGKSSIIRAFENILPPYICVDTQCPFCCSPIETEQSVCSSCQQLLTNSPNFIEKKQKILTVPLSVTEDRLIGTLDLEKTLKSGIVTFYPGLLAQANNNVLYIDEVNLLAEPLVNIILSTISMGWNNVERDNISFSHPVSCILIGSMNEEEGTLRPHFAERFGLSVRMKTDSSINIRKQIIKLNVFFSGKDQTKAEQKDQELQNHIIEASERLPKIEIRDQIRHLIVQLCEILKVDGTRVDITIFRTARAMAALDDENEIQSKHVYEAARLALFHRTRNLGTLPPVTEAELAFAFRKALQGLGEEAFTDDEFVEQIELSQTKLKILIGSKMKKWKVVGVILGFLLFLSPFFLLLTFEEFLTFLIFMGFAAIGLVLAYLALPKILKIRETLIEKIDKYEGTRGLLLLRIGSIAGFIGISIVLFIVTESLSLTPRLILVSSILLINLSIILVLNSKKPTTDIEGKKKYEKLELPRWARFVRIGILAFMALIFLQIILSRETTLQQLDRYILFLISLILFVVISVIPLKRPTKDIEMDKESLKQKETEEETKKEPKKEKIEEEEEEKSTYVKTTSRWPNIFENPIILIAILVALPALVVFITLQQFGIEINPFLIIPFFLIYVLFLLLITRSGGKIVRPVPLPWRDQGKIHSAEFEEPAYEDFPIAQEIETSALEVDETAELSDSEIEEAIPISQEWSKLTSSSLISYIPKDFRTGHPLFSKLTNVSVPATPIIIDEKAPLQSKARDIGKRTKGKTQLTKGKVIGWQPARQNYQNLHLPATIRKAASHDSKATHLALNISKDDLCEKRFSHKTKACIVFVIDLSKSMEPTIQSIAESIITLHKDAIAHRDRVGIIACKHLETTVAQAPTTNLFLVQKALKSLGVSGLTPLAGGVLLATQILRNEKRRDSSLVPVMIILSDGGTNVPLEFDLQTGKQRNLSKYTLWNGDGIPEAIKDLIVAGWLVRQERIKCLLVAPPSQSYDPSSAHGEKTLYRFRRITQGKIYRPRAMGTTLMNRLSKEIHSKL
ncbi:MAG: VWA domain-containing protein [Candidatus Hermodarchaeota archaeon]